MSKRLKEFTPSCLQIQCHLEEEAMCVLASLICPKIWFVSDMQTENTSTYVFPAQLGV